MSPFVNVCAVKMVGETNAVSERRLRLVECPGAGHRRNAERDAGDGGRDHRPAWNQRAIHLLPPRVEFLRRRFHRGRRLDPLSDRSLSTLTTGDKRPSLSF